VLYVLCAGVLLFQVAGEVEPVNDDTRVMEIFISGDACISIYTHLCPSDNTRPMALDILWQVRRCAELPGFLGDIGICVRHSSS
jgi:hypothetical protein